MYYYCVTAQIEACTQSRLSNEISGSVGVREYVSQPISMVSISPNPFTDVINFKIPMKQSLTIRIYDSKGVLVDMIEGKGHVYWQPKKHLPMGVYFIEVMTLKNKIIDKVIKIN